MPARSNDTEVADKCRRATRNFIASQFYGERIYLVTLHGQVHHFVHSSNHHHWRLWGTRPNRQIENITRVKLLT